MRTRLFLLWMLSLAGAVGAAAQELNFEVNTFHPVNGQDVYTGAADADARARIYSDGRQLYLEVDVTDDVVVSGPAETGTDRVEVWFALPGSDGVDEASPLAEPPAVPPVYVVAGGSRLYWYNHTADVDSFRQEATNPTIFIGGNEYVYADLVTPGRRNWIREEVDALITAPQEGSLKREHVFFGITHLGFFPDGRPAYLYDRDRYRIIEEQTGAELGPVEERARYAAHETAGGYRIRAELPPEAFAFFTKQGLLELRLLIDIVDVDEEGGTETLLSSTRSRVWGRPSMFERVVVRPPLVKSIHPQLSYLGMGGPAEPPHLWEHLPEVYLRTREGWTPVERQWGTLYAPTRRMLVELPNIQAVAFRRSVFDYRREEVGKHVVEAFDVADEDAPTGQRSLLVIDGRDTLSVEHLVGVLALPDGAPGLLTATYAYLRRGCLSGVSLACGCSVTSTLELRRPLDPAARPVPLATYSSCTGEVRVGGQILQEKDMSVRLALLERRRSSAFGPRFAWEEVLDEQWEGQQLQLQLNFGPSTRFRIAWNDDGGVEVAGR